MLSNIYHAQTSTIPKKKSLLCNSEDLPVKDYEFCDYKHHKLQGSFNYPWISSMLRHLIKLL